MKQDIHAALGGALMDEQVVAAMASAAVRSAVLG